MARKPSRKPATGGIQFMLPATGSTIIQAISSPNSAKISFTWSKLLKLTVKVCCANDSGIPGELGTPNVNAPEPALTNNESAWPW